MTMPTDVERDGPAMTPGRGALTQVPGSGPWTRLDHQIAVLPGGTILGERLEGDLR